MMTRDMIDKHVFFSCRHVKVMELAVKRGDAANASEFLRQLVETYERENRLLRSSEENHEIEQE